MALSPASLPHLALLGGHGTAVAATIFGPAPLPHLAMLGGLGAADVVVGPTYTLLAEHGTVTLSSQDVGLAYRGPATYILVAEHGTVTIRGSDALRDFYLAAEHGTVSLSGQSTDLTSFPAPGGGGPTYTMLAEHGTVVLNGQEATFVRSYRLLAEHGTVTIGGRSVRLNVPTGGPAQGSRKLILTPGSMMAG